jgi:hypothetical protein
MGKVMRVISVTFVFALVALQAVPATAGHDTCGGTSTKVNNVHWGTIQGAQSIKVIGQIRCTGSVDLIYDWFVVLWKCGNLHPEANESWLESNCIPFTHIREVGPVAAGTTVSNRAPTDSDAPVTATGWYMGDMRFVAQDGHPTKQTRSYGWYWSPARYCSAATHTCS